MNRSVVITGLGVVTPLGCSAAELLMRLRAQESAAAAPSSFDASSLPCKLCADIRDFDPAAFVPEPKTVRMMNRDALLVVAAARKAMEDAGLKIGAHYSPHQVGLFGSTGLSGMALSEVTRLVETAAAPDGSLDLHRFGEVALKQVRPVLSFRILSNMPIAFVSIFENLQGPNVIYNPWEGHGAQAIARAIRTIARGDAQAALAVGCDVKTHDLAYIALTQCGALSSWEQHGTGTIPGEGAGALVLEEESAARARGARILARVVDYRVASLPSDDSQPKLPVSSDRAAAGLARPRLAPSPGTPGEGWGEGLRPDNQRSAVYLHILAPFVAHPPAAIISAADGDPSLRDAESTAFKSLSLHAERTLRPKLQMGNLFAAAAAVQCCIGAAMAAELSSGDRVLVNCFGFGSEQGAFLLEAP